MGTIFLFFLFGLCILLSPIWLPLLLIYLAVKPSDKSSTVHNQTVKPSSLTGEIEKLYFMKENGIITQEEFEKGKSKLL